MSLRISLRHIEILSLDVVIRGVWTSPPAALLELLSAAAGAWLIASGLLCFVGNHHAFFPCLFPLALM